MSARLSTFSGVRICSGAMNSGVPMTPWRLIDSSLPASASRNREMPKSRTFTWSLASSLSVRKMLSDLRSR